MLPHPLLHYILLTLPLLSPLTTAQSSGSDGYIGYTLTSRNDANNDVIYATDSTASNATSTTSPPPDVALNASVSVGEIDIVVSNLTAKINLDVQVLSLLQFSAGVTASIDRVSLTIKNVSAVVQLEARLSNLVLMVSDVLDSIDLNPVIASLASAVNSTVNSTVSTVTGTTTKRSLDINLADNILYSINDYSGHTHTNRVLAQNGDIVDQSLDNEGDLLGSRVVGSYLRDMRFNGYNQSVAVRGVEEREEQWVYAPYVGLEVVSAIYMDGTGKVVATQVLSESGGGGTSTLVGP